jgi:aminoglycoside phosphotransferase (APT) family kinase protein
VATADPEVLRQRLARIESLGATNPEQITNLRRLSGGASKETWSLDVANPSREQHLILRRTADTVRPEDPAIAIESEAELIRLAAASGVPVPQVHYVLKPADELGRGYIMNRVEGETLARRIIRDSEYAGARRCFARQAGAILARIHAIDVSHMQLAQTTAREELDLLRARYERIRWPRPVFAFALCWLLDNLPSSSGPPRLVHGDFRNGNFIFGPDSVRAVLDWELAHRGDPMDDLAWLCINSWRFGAIDKPVGGIGEREELYSAYEEASGLVIDRPTVNFWEVLGTLRWGTFCAAMIEWIHGGDTSVERVMIARRASETEIDLMRLLLPRN